MFHGTLRHGTIASKHDGDLNHPFVLDYFSIISYKIILQVKEEARLHYSAIDTNQRRDDEYLFEFNIDQIHSFH